MKVSEKKSIEDSKFSVSHLVSVIWMIKNDPLWDPQILGIWLTWDFLSSEKEWEKVRQREKIWESQIWDSQIWDLRSEIRDFSWDEWESENFWVFLIFFHPRFLKKNQVLLTQFSFSPNSKSSFPRLRGLNYSSEERWDKWVCPEWRFWSSASRFIRGYLTHTPQQETWVLGLGRCGTNPDALVLLMGEALTRWPRYWFLYFQIVFEKSSKQCVKAWNFEPFINRSEESKNDNWLAKRRVARQISICLIHSSKLPNKGFKEPK